jgi:hypothetical protein
VVPFLATSFPECDEAVARLQAADRAEARAQGIQVLFTVPWGPQGIYAKKDINTVDDMKGLKWRAYNVGTARIGELVGAQAVTVQAASCRRRSRPAVSTRSCRRARPATTPRCGRRSPTSTTPAPGFRATSCWSIGRAGRARQADQDAILRLAKTAEERGWKMWEHKTEWYHDRDRQARHEGAQAER